MSKNIVFCADGTWNHPHSPVMVEEADTNIYKLFKSLDFTSSQFTAYDDGVGANGIVPYRLLGGAFGIGLFQKIKDGYTALAHTYEKGDKIFIFGFSRGAYTARSLAGMVAVSGLPTSNFDTDCVEVAFEAYRDKSRRTDLLTELNARYAMENAKISVLGVWDTVGALGVPGALFGDSEADILYGFLDTSLHEDVLAAYQALAIDERRGEFQPTLWTSPPVAGQIIEQVWFSGVHCDVGGGYAQTGLSDITLSWMLSKARQHGLNIIDDAWTRYSIVDAKHALEEAHESWNVLWGFPKRRAVPANASVSDSVQIRLMNEPAYRPPNLNLDDSGNLKGYSTVVVVIPPSSTGL